jgi:H+-transporting ATPase
MIDTQTPPSSESISADDASELTVEALQQQLDAPAEGLSGAEAEHRLVRFGPNELQERAPSVLVRILGHFWGPIPWMIEAAAALSAAVGHREDFVIILVLLMSNAAVGFWEEYRAGNAIAALKEGLAQQARVKRDGTWTTLPARQLVPGDLIRLRIGDIVPADVKLLGEDEVEVDQSALTGESLPVEQGAGAALFSGSILRRGESDALVFATGDHTYFAKTAHLVEGPEAASHFQRAVLKIGDYLIVVAVVLVAMIIGVAMFRGDGMFTTLQFALVLTVAAIPVAMPTVLSVTMAVGSHLLAKRQAIVSRLASIEEMAGIDVLCSDKTGTLTQNKLSMGKPFTVEGVDPREVVLTAGLASRAEDGDPIDLAVLEGLEPGWDASYTVSGFQPFDPVVKRTQADVVGPDATTFRVSKGAPQVIMALVPHSESLEAEVQEAIDGFASRGFRALAVARTGADGQWHLLGVLPLFDPPRDDSADVIHTAQELGVDVKMVTGDQVAIARETARRLETGTSILDASAFDESSETPHGNLADTIEQADGFAQVYPEHKYRIVEALQSRGHIVGMTGDGVNDAPALQRADAGIAVSGATDAARAAADIVLLSPGLSVIVEAIQEARKIFQRMTNYAIYRIAETIRVLLFMTLSILVFNFYPVTAVMIVLLALLNDGAILSIAYDRVVYNRRPEKWDMRQVLGLATMLGIAGVTASFLLFYLADRVFEMDAARIQTLMYLKLSVAGHLTVFVTRTRGPFWSIKPSRALFMAVTGTQAMATLIAVYGLFMTPIGWVPAAAVWGYALIWFLISDRIKILSLRMLDPQRKPLLSLARDRPRRHVRREKAAGHEPQSPTGQFRVDVTGAPPLEHRLGGDRERKSDTQPHQG